MRKKFKIIFSMVVSIIILAFILFLVDLGRVQRQEKPLFCIKSLSGTYMDGGTQEYWGLGYKIIDFNRLDGYDAIKIGSWFMQYQDFAEEYHVYEEAFTKQQQDIISDNTFVNRNDQNKAIDNVGEPDKTLQKVSMKIKEGTLTKTGATIIITDKNETPYTYGTWYRIDKKVEGKWKACKPIVEDYGFTDIAMLVGKDKTLEIKEDWSKLYGALEVGTYRFVKSQYEAEGYSYFWVEFTIT